jgi:uncharacterized membrane protein
MDTVIATFHLHPIIDHFTIALLSVAVLTDILASAIAAVVRDRDNLLRAWSGRLSATALQLMVLGAAAAILSHFTGESEANRLWDTMSPAAQAILFSDDGSKKFLSHAILGTYLMYTFLILAVWRVLSEVFSVLKRTRVLYLLVAAFALAALLYQGKTGGELVYDQGVGTPRGATRTTTR